MQEDERGALITHHIAGSAEDARNKVCAYFDDLRETVSRQEEAGLAVVNNYVREKLLSLRQQQEDMAVLLSQVTSVCVECERALKRSDAEVSCHSTLQHTAVVTKVVRKSVKAYVTMPKGNLGNTQ